MDWALLCMERQEWYCRISVHLEAWAWSHVASHGRCYIAGVYDEMVKTLGSILYMVFLKSMDIALQNRVPTQV
jgi:hypothetical protein